MHSAHNWTPSQRTTKSRRRWQTLLIAVLLLVGFAIPAGADTSSGRPGAGGFWSVAPDGRVTAGGGAPHFGDTYTMRLPNGALLADVLWEPVIGIAATQSGNGYWLAARDSGVFAFGDALYHGNLIDALIERDNLPPGTLNGDNILDYLHGEIVDIDSTGDGYYLLGKDGGVFTFGHLPFHGSLSGHLGTDAVSLELINGGYVLHGANGGQWTCSGGTCVFGRVTPTPPPTQPPTTQPPPPSTQPPPTTQPNPPAAPKEWRDGVHLLSAIPTGWYRITPDPSDFLPATYHSIERPNGTIIRNEFIIDGPQAVWVEATDGADRIDIAGIMRRMTSPIDPRLAPSGVYRVGYDIGLGQYVILPVDGASYWAATDRYGNIRDNDFSFGQSIATVQAGDELLVLNGSIQLP